MPAFSPVSGSHRGTDRRKALETNCRDFSRGIKWVTGERTAERHWRRMLRMLECPQQIRRHRGTDRRKALETIRRCVTVAAHLVVTGERTAERHWRPHQDAEDVGMSPVTGERTAERHWRLAICSSGSGFCRACHRGTDRRKALETSGDSRGQPAESSVTGERTAERHWRLDLHHGFTAPCNLSPGNGPPKGIGDSQRRTVYQK